MSTLYTYGCSFTNYSWDTWADHMGKNFDKFINYGKTGAGNQYILHKLTESDAKGEISNSDNVAIMWSTAIRYDAWLNGTWRSLGNVFNNGYPKEFTDLVDPTGFLIRDYSFVHAAKKILDNIGCRYIFFSMTPLDHFSEYAKDRWLDRMSDKKTVQQYKKIYSKTIECILPSAFEVLWQNDWTTRTVDLNPSDTRYEVFAGADWPTIEDLEAGTVNEKDFSCEIIEEMCDLLHAENFNDLVNNKLYIPRDLHPTSEMHLEYLDAVLPDWRTWH